MKKKSTIIFLMIMLLLLVTGCSKKTAITADEFKTKMQEKNYVITDTKESQFSDDSNIKNALLAIDEGYNYQIEFYETNTIEEAQKMYENNKKLLQSGKGSSAAETTVSLKNYEKYSLSADNKYKVVSRVDNTMIFLDVDDKYSDEIKELLKELNY